MRVLVALLVCVSCVGVVSPELQAQEEPIRKLNPVDPEEAEMTAALATLTGAITGGSILAIGLSDPSGKLEDDVLSAVGFSVMVLSLSLGPSTGLMMGDMWTRGILSALGRLGFLTLGTFVLALGFFESGSSFCDPTFEDCSDPLIDEGTALVATGLVTIGAGLMWGFYDIGDTDEQISKRQRPFQRASLGLVPTSGGALLTLSLSR